MPETSAGAIKLHVTVYPSGWTVCWLTRMTPTENGPRSRYVARWSTHVSSPDWLQNPQALVQTAMEAYKP